MEVSEEGDEEVPAMHFNKSENKKKESGRKRRNEFEK